MNWLLPILTFVLGLSTSAVLFLGWQLRRHRRNEEPPIAPHEEETSLPEHPHASAGSANKTKVASAPSQTTRNTQIGFENPRRAFHSAFISGDTERAVKLLPELEDLLGGREKHGILAAAATLASAGKEEALPYLLDAIQSEVELSEQLLQGLVAGIVQYYVSTDRETDGLNAVEKDILKYAYDESKSEEYRAFVANQLQMLYFGSNRPDDALALIEYVIGLSPNDPSYHFNKSIILEQLERLHDAVQAIEKCIALDAHEDREHLYQALDLYRKVGDTEKIRSTGERLGIRADRG